MTSFAKISEKLKVDLALDPQSLASGNDTGQYFNAIGYKRLLFYFTAAAVAATKTVVAQILEAKDGVATDAQDLTGATATITALTKATKGLYTANTVADGNTVTVTIFDEKGTQVSSQVYTCEDTAPDATAGEFASGANDAAAMVNFAAVINSLQGDYLQAVAGSSPDVVTLNVKEPGQHTMTMTTIATLVASNLEACGYIEVDASQLSSGFTHAALKITTDATIVAAGFLVREGLSSGQERPGQAVAASKVL